MPTCRVPRRSPRTPAVRRIAAVLAATLVAGLTAGVGAAVQPAGAATLSFSAEADTYVSALDPKASFGKAKTLVVDGSPEMEAYVRFTVKNVSESVQRAHLRLWATPDGGSADGPAVYPAATSWAEPRVTWLTRPARLAGTPLADAGAVPGGAWLELEVTEAITGNGTYAFNLAATSADATIFSSREDKKRSPELIVETAPLVDTTPPDTTIDSGPSGSVTSTSATFTFSANESGASFACSLDGSAYSLCASPKAYSGLGLGQHTFAVRATDLAGNTDPTPATRTWEVAEAPTPGGTLLVPASGALWGAHHKIKNSAPVDDKQTAITDFEALLGRNLGIDMYYEPWGNVFPTWRESWDFASGRIPMISWGKTKTTDITAGKHDAYIRDRAQGLKALGKPLFVRWFWEMDGTRNADVAVSPSAYIAAWRYLRTMFADEGVTNVAWVWCPNASRFETGKAQEFYPGDEWVDWVCADGYNWYPSDNRDYQGFEEKFQAFYDWSVARGKPAMAGEYGSQKMEPGRRAQWLTDARQALKTTMTNMKAVVYFHSYSSDYDWQFYNEPDALEAFSRFGLDPFFKP